MDRESLTKNPLAVTIIGTVVGGLILTIILWLWRTYALDLPHFGGQV